MRVDGKAIAAEIAAGTAKEVHALARAPRLTICTCTPTEPTRRYLARKKALAAKLGVAVNLVEYDAQVTTFELISSFAELQQHTDGLLVQLPLPASLDTEEVVRAIPAAVDADAMGYTAGRTALLPPVVGAIAEISRVHGVAFAGARVVVVGAGVLVGAPAAKWAERQGATVHVVTKDSTDPEAEIAAADILILGAGVPELVTPRMVKRGVVIFDAGTSESGGALVGDAAPGCARRASLITPVPGGVGPITVALLLRNVVQLSRAAQTSFS